MAFLQHNPLKKKKTEIYQSISILNPSFMSEVFVTNVLPYNPGRSTNLVLPKARISLYGIDTIRFVGQTLWQNIPKEIRVSKIGDFSKKY